MGNRPSKRLLLINIFSALRITRLNPTWADAQAFIFAPLALQSPYSTVTILEDARS